MTVTISSEVLTAVAAAVAAEPDTEVCGLLFGSDTAIEASSPCRNVADDRAIAFELDPQVLIEAHRASRAGGPSVIGHYHSHPRGPAVPSPTDAAHADAQRQFWLIVAGSDTGLWRAKDSGPVHDRFEAVAYRVIEPCTRRGGPPKHPEPDGNP